MTVHTVDQSHQPVQVKVYGNATTSIATQSGTSDQAFTFTVPNVKTWSPDSPVLYNITVQVGQDNVETYTGFRTLEKGTVNGVTRPLLNGEFIFAFGTLE